MVSSHLLHDVERICDRVMIIAGGRILEHDSLENLKNRHRRIVEFLPAAEPERFAAALTEAGLAVERLSNGRLRVESSAESIDWILVLMRDRQLPPAEIISNPNALHELFLKALAGTGNGNHA